MMSSWALITGILWPVGQFASLLLFWAYIIQKFILFSWLLFEMRKGEDK